MLLNIYFGFFELEAETTQDNLWLEHFIKSNYNNLDFDIIDESKNHIKSKEVELNKEGNIDNLDIIDKIIIGNF